MSRISVSLPDELTARLDPVKEKINVSQVCREALERQIAALERASGQDGEELDCDALISRLREERATANGGFEQLGNSNAMSWVKTASYQDIKSLLEDEDGSDMENYRLPRRAFKIMKRDAAAVKITLEGARASAYKTAWRDSVRSIWAEVEPEQKATAHEEPAEVVE